MDIMTDTQTQIVRQSSLKFVNEYVSMLDQPIGMYETVAVAEIITDYVLNGRTTEVNTRLKNFDKFLLEGTGREIVDKIKFEMEK